MRIALTGANGFVGQAIARTLEQQGVEVLKITRSKRQQIGRPGRIEITKRDALPDLAKAFANMDAIVHAAGWSGSAANITDARRLAEADINISTHIAEQAGIAGKRLIYVSSIKAATDCTDGQSVNEATEPHPHGVYGATKLACEREITKIRGIDYTILRPPGLYGPKMKSNLLKFFAAAERGIPLPLGAIRNQRNLLYIDSFADLVATIVAKRTSPRIVLAKDGPAMSTSDLYRAIAASLGRKARIFPAPVALFDAALRAFSKHELANSLFHSLEIDDTASRKALGWQPPHDFDSAIEETARWFRTRPCTP